LAKGHCIEVRGIAPQRQLFVRAAGGIIEYGPRDALFREFAQVVDAQNGWHCAMRLRVRLRREPDIDAAVFGAGAAAIMSVREKPVMAAGGRARMIMAVLRSRIGPIVVPMIVAMLRRLLIVVVILPVLREQGRWRRRAERKCCHRQNERLPS
jgi:hypothetical protein